MIDWIEKRKSGRVNATSRKTVVISVSKSTVKSGKRVWFYFGEYAAKALLDGNVYQYIRIGVDARNGKIYFDRSDSKEGYKASKSGESGNKKLAVGVSDGVYKFLEKRTGEYPLYYDDKTGLFFIIVNPADERGDAA